MVKKKGLFNKIQVFVIVLFLIILSVFSASGITISNDTCPPETTFSLDPKDPDGENGWYVNDVNITLNATDDLSGVKEIYYRVAEGEWNVSFGDSVKFIITYDCSDDLLIEFYAVDFAGNKEETKSFSIDIDQQPPEIEYDVEVVVLGLIFKIYKITISTLYWDNCSDIDRIEFYLNGVLQYTQPGHGPDYEWTLKYWPHQKFYFKIRIYDQAGHYVDVFINNSDIHFRSRINFVNQYSSNILLKWFFNRFIFLDRFFNIIKYD